MERNISVAKINGYTLEKVLKAKAYLDEIGKNRRRLRKLGKGTRKGSNR